MGDPQPLISYADYLAMEEVAETKHEYIAGVVYAMVGGTRQHSRIGTNITTALGLALRGGPCEVFNSDQRVRGQVTDIAAYPDVQVVCGEPRGADDDPEANANPVVLVEVLSRSTATYDRGAKSAHYRRIPSVQHILLVSQDEVRVEHYRRDGDVWVLRDVTEGTIALPEIGASLVLADAYARTGLL